MSSATDPANKSLHMWTSQHPLCNNDVKRAPEIKGSIGVHLAKIWDYLITQTHRFSYSIL